MEEIIRKFPGLCSLWNSMQQKSENQMDISVEYTLSEEFLVYQYKLEFVEALIIFMKQAAKEHLHSELLALYVPFGIMYGVFLQGDEKIEDNVFFDTRVGKEFLTVFEEHLDCEEAQQFAMKMELLCYHMAARVYRPLAQAYLASYVVRNEDTEWKLWYDVTHSPIWYPEFKVTLAFPEYEWSSYLQEQVIKNDGSFYRMLEQLIRNSQEIQLDHMMRMNQWVHLETLRHSVQGTLVADLIKAVEETTRRKVEILAGIDSYVKTVEDFKQAVEGSCDSGFCRELLVRALKNQEFFAVRREKEFADFLLEFLSQPEKLNALWYILYERYYFIPEPTEQEKRVKDFLNSFEMYVESYWQMVMDNYNETNER